MRAIGKSTTATDERQYLINDLTSSNPPPLLHLPNPPHCGVLRIEDHIGKTRGIRRPKWKTTHISSGRTAKLGVSSAFTVVSSHTNLFSSSRTCRQYHRFGSHLKYIHDIYT